MNEIEGKRCLTIAVSAGTDYAVTYPYEQYTDIINCTEGDLLVSGEVIGEDNYITIMAGGAYNDFAVVNGTVYLRTAAAGAVSLIAR